MDAFIQRLIVTILCGGLFCCKEKTQQSSMAVDTKVIHPDPHLEWLAKVGGRLPRENDVPFVFAPMDDNVQLEMLLLPMKEAGISLALPDAIHLGNGLWKIAPEDVERARSLVDKLNLKESLKNFHFE
jgi:hypothetical protein